jgi:hypothetical protein
MYLRNVCSLLADYGALYSVITDRSQSLNVFIIHVTLQFCGGQSLLMVSP